MASKKPTPDIFDQWASAAPAAGIDKGAGNSEMQDAAAIAATPTATPVELRRAVQELLKNGVLEHSAKPQMFSQIANDTARVNAQLEPLDLEVRVDDVRGLAFVAVAPSYLPESGDDEDEWTHPLMRRQRLTLEQSLLLAILRREFLQREQESGTGAVVRVTVDSLLPQLETYLGSTGSDMQERKRLTQLLENLRTHGMVSEVDAQDCITIRPMIVHLLNPENLQTLLLRLREVAEQGSAAKPEGTP